MGRKAEAGGEVEVARKVGEATAGGELYRCVMASETNTPQWLLDIAANDVDAALSAIQRVDDYLDMARGKLVAAAHPPVNLLALASTWTLPVSGAPTNYTFTDLGDSVEITKLGTGAFGVMSVCDGLVVQAGGGEAITISLELSGAARWWAYKNVRDVTVSLGQIVRVGQPIGNVRMSLVLSGYYATHLCERARFSPMEFLGAHGVPGVGK